jgi:hypothetical protein
MAGGSSVVVPTLNQLGNSPSTIAQQLIAVTTAVKADLDELIDGASGVLLENTARAVITSIAAYTAAGGVLTANANGAIGAQDGVTLAVGDQVFLGEDKATAAKDAGPYVVTALGAAGAKFVLSRPSWWATGAGIPQGVIIDVGGEGTAFAGSQWKSFVAPAKLVDTDAPLFWPKQQKGTTGAAVAGVTPSLSTLFVRASTSSVIPVPKTPGGTQGTPRISTQTAGLPTASSIVVTSSSGTDTSTFDVHVTNW